VHTAENLGAGRDTAKGQGANLPRYRGEKESRENINSTKAMAAEVWGPEAGGIDDELNGYGFGAYPTTNQPPRVSRTMVVECVECGRTFDLLNEPNADEWAFGHDCEV